MSEDRLTHGISPRQQSGGFRRDVMSDHFNLLTGAIKQYITKYGDYLVDVYQKVKVGGALRTSKQERDAVFRLAHKYQQFGGQANRPMSERNFTQMVRSIPTITGRNRPHQSGGGFHRPVSNQPSRRLRPIYRDYLTTFQS